MVKDLGVFLDSKLTLINYIEQTINYDFKMLCLFYPVLLALNIYLVLCDYFIGCFKEVGIFFSYIEFYAAVFH